MWLLEPDRVIPLLLAASPCCAAASQYLNDTEFVRAANALQQQGAEVVVSDCMGYD